jgi:hypothetical protein
VHPDRDAWRSGRRKLVKLERLALRRKKRRAKLARQLKELPAESAVWKKRTIVAALCEELPRLERLQADVSRAEAHARLAARRFGEQVGIAGLSRVVPVAAAIDGSDESLPDVLLPEGFAQSFGPLRARARDCSRASRSVKEAKRGLAEVRRSLAESKGSIKGAGAALGGVTIAEAIAQAGDRTAALRRRIASGEQLADLDRTVARLEREAAASLEGQLIPVPWLVGGPVAVRLAHDSASGTLTMTLSRAGFAPFSRTYRCMRGECMDRRAFCCRVRQRKRATLTLPSIRDVAEGVRAE